MKTSNYAYKIWYKISIIFCANFSNEVYYKKVTEYCVENNAQHSKICLKKYNIYHIIIDFYMLWEYNTLNIM